MSNTPDFLGRLNQLRHQLSSQQAILLSTPSDITYFSGFITLVPQEREALLLVTAQNAYLCHAHFSPFTASEHIKGIKGSTVETVLQIIEDLKNSNAVKEIIVDETNLFVNEYKELEKHSDVSLTAPDRRIIWDLRSVKDASEQAAIKKAADIAKQAMTIVIKKLATGQTERDVCNLIETELKNLGSEQPAFPTIVAFGMHSALPHHQPSSTTLSENTVVLLDFGATYQGYKSDMTRTVWFGTQLSDKFQRVEKIVNDAYQAAKKTLDTLKHEVVTAKSVDDATRSLIAQAGYANEFIHTTGHGVGLDIHERPSLNWNNTSELKPGMVITIEPGIYFEGEFGYRYENSLLLTPNGALELTL